MTSRSHRNRRIFYGCTFVSAVFFVLLLCAPRAASTPSAAHITGSIAISGTAAFGEPLRADESAVKPTGATLTYYWLRGTEQVGSAAVYVPTLADLGKEISLMVTGAGNYEGSLRSAVVVPGKAQQFAPPAPTALSMSAFAVELTPMAGCEYSMDGKLWQSSPVFSGLSEGSAYRFYARYAQTQTHHSSAQSAALQVTTPRVTLIGSIKILGTAQYGALLSVDTAALQPAGALLSYLWLCGEAVVGSGATYRVAQADIGKTLSVTVSGRESYRGSVRAVGVLAKKAAGAVYPSAPKLLSVTEDAVTLDAKTGVEYRVNGGNWQSGGSFTSLRFATQYRFDCRYAESATHSAGAPGAVLTAKTLPKSNAASGSQPRSISCEKWLVQGNYLRCVPAETTAAALLSQLNERTYLRLTQDGMTLSAAKLVGSGTRVELLNAADKSVIKSLSVVVTGDVNGDGKQTLTDFVQIKAHLLEKRKLTGAQKQAADLNADGKVTLTDFVQMKAHLLGKRIIVPN